MSNKQIKQNYEDEGGPDLHQNRENYNGLGLREIALIAVGIGVVVTIIFYCIS